MNILLAYLWSPYTTAAYYAKAFRNLGHDVRTVGPVNEAATLRVPEHQRYRLTGPHYFLTEPPGSYFDLMRKLGDWWPNLFVWIEAGGGWSPEWIAADVPAVAYVIDSHSRLAQHLAQIKPYDHVFCAHRQYADALDAHWLPMACDPDVHTPTRVGGAEYDVAFVGNTYGDSPLYAKRRKVLSELAKRYWCNFASGVYFEDMANVYASAWVAFNISAAGDLNMRVFEAMCSGRPLVTDWAYGLLDLFRNGIHLYAGLTEDEDWGGLPDMVEDMLAVSVGNRIGCSGREAVLAHHTYEHRAAQMLEAVGL